MRAEVGITQLDRHRARLQVVLAQLGGHLVAHAEQLTPQLHTVTDVPGEGLLPAHGLDLTLGHDGPVVDAVGRAPQPLAVSPEPSTQVRQRQSRQIADDLEAQTLQGRSAYGAGAPQPGQRQRGEKGRLGAGRHDHDAVRLAQVTGNLGHQLVGRDPERSRQPQLGLHPILQGTGKPSRPPARSGFPGPIELGAGDIQKSFVDGNLLQERRAAPSRAITRCDMAA